MYIFIEKYKVKVQNHLNHYKISIEVILYKYLRS
jgi:hypothetical protein